MLVPTVLVILPVVGAAGIDPVWFGVFIVLMCEISPSVGMAPYVIQALRKEDAITQLFAGTIPFFIAMVVMTGLLIAFPQMALCLPRLTLGS